eukprot:scaffold3696_cov27-Tisochrysis_lutea.AAC.1
MYSTESYISQKTSKGARLPSHSTSRNCSIVSQTAASPKTARAAPLGRSAVMPLRRAIGGSNRRRSGQSREARARRGVGAGDLEGDRSLERGDPLVDGRLALVEDAPAEDSRLAGESRVDPAIGSRVFANHWDVDQA